MSSRKPHYVSLFAKCYINTVCNIKSGVKLTPTVFSKFFGLIFIGLDGWPQTSHEISFYQFIIGQVNGDCFYNYES